MSNRLRMLIERARTILEEEYIEPIEFEPAPEIHVFDFDLTLQHKYKPLPCVEIMRQYIKAQIPVYIVTAREPNKGQEQHICDVLNWWDLKFDPTNVFAVGNEVEKGPYVLDLIDRHGAEKCTFYDDKEENCESVFKHCADACENLHVYWLSAAIPGDVRKEIISNEDDVRIEIKPSLQERKLFRNWRRLSKII